MNLEDRLWELHYRVLAPTTLLTFQEVCDTLVNKEFASFLQTVSHGTRSVDIFPEESWFYCKAYTNYDEFHTYMTEWVRVPEGRFLFASFQEVLGFQAEYVKQLGYLPCGAYFEDQSGTISFVPNGYVWFGPLNTESISHDVIPYMKEEVDDDLLNVHWQKISFKVFRDIEKYRELFPSITDLYPGLDKKLRLENERHAQSMPYGFFIPLCADPKEMKYYKCPAGLWVAPVIQHMALGLETQMITKLPGKAANAQLFAIEMIVFIIIGLLDFETKKLLQIKELRNSLTGCTSG